MLSCFPGSIACVVVESHPPVVGFNLLATDATRLLSPQIEEAQENIEEEALVRLAAEVRALAP
jgi:hypothetical protein